MIDIIAKLYCSKKEGLGWWKPEYNHRRFSLQKCSWFQRNHQIDCSILDEEQSCDDPTCVGLLTEPESFTGLNMCLDTLIANAASDQTLLDVFSGNVGTY